MKNKIQFHNLIFLLFAFFVLATPVRCFADDYLTLNYTGWWQDTIQYEKNYYSSADSLAEMQDIMVDKGFVQELITQIESKHQTNYIMLYSVWYNSNLDRYKVIQSYNYTFLRTDCMGYEWAIKEIEDGTDVFYGYTRYKSYVTTRYYEYNYYCQSMTWDDNLYQDVFHNPEINLDGYDFYWTSSDIAYYPIDNVNYDDDFYSIGYQNAQPQFVSSGIDSYAISVDGTYNLVIMLDGNVYNTIQFTDYYNYTIAINEMTTDYGSHNVSLICNDSNNNFIATTGTLVYTVGESISTSLTNYPYWDETPPTLFNNTSGTVDIYVNNIYQESVVSRYNGEILESFLNSTSFSDGEYYHVKFMQNGLLIEQIDVQFLNSNFTLEFFQNSEYLTYTDTLVAPMREDFANNIWGGIQHALSYLIYIVKYPIVLVIGFIIDVTTNLENLISQTGEFKTFVTDFFSFLPRWLVNMLGALVIGSFIAFIVKVVRN